MAGWHSDASQFHGDTNKALEQMNRDLTGQAPPEETDDERLARQAYDSQREAAEERMREAEASVQRSQQEQNLSAKAASDAARAHKADASNYFHARGELYYQDQNGRTYHVQNGRHVYVKNPPKNDQETELRDAFTKSASRKTNSALPRF